MTYEHRQHGKMHLLLSSIALLLVVLSLAMRSDPRAMWLGLGIAVLVGVVALAFVHLDVRTQAGRTGEELLVRFGPLPIFSKRTPIAQIEAVRAARSTIGDGWGIHWAPGRGWIWNLWGFDCVELTLTGGKKLRIGTDEPQRLSEYLAARLRPEGPESSAPESSAPKSSAPKSSAPESSAPESSAPESSAPESSAPESSVPGQAETAPNAP